MNDQNRPPLREHGELPGEIAPESQGTAAAELDGWAPQCAHESMAPQCAHESVAPQCAPERKGKR